MEKPAEDPIQTARDQFLSSFPPGPLATEKVHLEMLVGRTLSEDVTAPIDSPPYTRSIMEGYLVHAPETKNATDESPAALTVTGRITPGEAHIQSLPPHSAVEVCTGSYIPAGSDLGVVRQWDAERMGDQVLVKKGVPAGANLEAQGCDFQKGSVRLNKGHTISPEDICLLASMGILTVSVARLPRVVVFSSGDEVIPPTEPMKPGAIWDCNSYGLSALIRAHGAQAHFKGIMRDDLDQCKKHLQEALEEADMLVVSGGTAVGGRDFMAELINSLGAPGVVVNGVPMRGGKPLIMGVIRNKPVVCLAGHPPEAIRGFHLFGQPALARQLGRTAPGPAG